MPAFTEVGDFIRLTTWTCTMPFLLRLWWKLTLSPQAYQERWRDHQITDDLRDLCGFIGLRLADSEIWKHFNVPYNPIRSFDEIDNLLYDASKASERARRRWFLYEAMRKAGDVTPARLAALQCTPEWHEFNDWLKDQ